MTLPKTCTCIRCDKKLGNYLAIKDGYQPADGLAFFSYGHYGSTYFDPMDGRSYLAIVVCDECVKEAEERLGVVRRVVHSDRAMADEEASQP